MQYKNILIFNPFGIGDVIFSTPIVRLLKENNPKSNIYYICNRRVIPVLETNPFITDIFVYEKDEYREIARKSKINFLKELFEFYKKIKSLKIDIMIDLSLNHQASLFAILCGIKTRIGFNYKNRGRFLTKKLPLKGFDYKHVALYYMDLMDMMDIHKKLNFYEVFVDKAITNPVKEKEYVVVIPGGGSSWGSKASNKRWSHKKFAKIVDRFIERYKIEVVLVGSLDERDLCNKIEDKVSDKLINISGEVSMKQHIKVLKDAKFVLANDGGSLHLAVALGTPVIGIYGPVDEKVYGPFDEDATKNIIVVNKEIACRPCYKRFRQKKCNDKKCLSAITVEQVWDAILIMCEKVGLKHKFSVDDLKFWRQNE